ncbi:DUF1549 domain-containing protein [Bremerella cremea]|uniref:DUF1549 domain-containing protein n=1 Tax=Bremerella cremea TaxID=1031537 RepID=UPI0031EE4A9C
MKHTWTLAILLLLLAALPCSANEIAAQIDKQLNSLLPAGTAAAVPCDEATFLRRVSLDLIGRIPTAAEAQAFASRKNPNARAEVIAELANSPAAAQRLATFVRSLWFPQTSVAPYEYLAPDTEAWVAQQLRRGEPLNEIARQLISVSYAPQTGAGKNEALLSVPKTIIEANDHRPERMAANATGEFLGVDLSCAQCHDHPFHAWSQDQFWQTAAYFEPLKSGETAHDAWQKQTIAIPDTERTVSPALFTGESWSPDVALATAISGREVFAQWVSQQSNRYFARWTVNQLWAELLGEPLVTLHPEQFSPAAREQTLELLSHEFVKRRFDLRWLASTIVATQAYQAKSTANSGIESEYPFIQVRGLTGPQLFDSLSVAAGRPPIRTDLDSAETIVRRSDFVAAFPAYRTVDAQRSATQALALMNGPIVEQFCVPQSNPLVQGLAAAPFLSEEECVTSLFWSTLGRAPHDEEWKRLSQRGFLQEDADTRARRLSELFWVLINTVEFNTNH